ncbi:MAG TPA: Na+-transporting NADH:ubiquinone oxidoreductase subunit D [Clostridiales bacterium]|nr:Na+-transporting NADH:ubiquinone oxidoreductase subunit D [Clostridiales bacterium]
MKAKEYTFDASYQPQVRTNTDTSRIMLDVIIALVPAMVVGIVMFGVKALLLIAVSVASAVFWEWGYRKLMKKPSSIGDLSACVTGILVALVIPVGAPWWMPVVGTFFAMVIVKQLYGGIGKNFLNPALAARAFLMASWPVIMTTWAVPSVLSKTVDAATMATPLSILKAGTETMPDYFSFGNLFIGSMPGCIGEISAAALLVGGIYLLVRKVINWRIPVAFIGTVAILTVIFPRNGYSNIDWMAYNLLSGGLLLGAIFMATDYSSSPVTLNGQLLYGFGCGALTVLIRYFGGYPEGVSYAILIMNLCAWAIDKGTRGRQFGVTKEDLKAAKKAAKEAKA